MTDTPDIPDPAGPTRSNRADGDSTDTGFTVHTLDSAPEGSQPLLSESMKTQGRIAALHAVMAEAPGLLQGYRTLHDLFLASSFDDEEITVVWQCINVEHNCHYCVPAHTAIARAMKVDDVITEALRNETPLPTARLEALRAFTLAVVRERGFVSEPTVQSFLDAGFTRRHVLEVVLGISQKVMSNYTNHLAHTELDRAFKKFAWEKKPSAADVVDPSRLDPELAVMIPALPPEMAEITRDNLGALRAGTPDQEAEPASTPVDIEEHIIQTQAVGRPDVRVLVYRKPSDEVQAGLLWIHGGGYILGTADDDRARRIAEQLDCAVVSVEYRLAPENPFPAGLNDCHAALLWVFDNAKALHIDESRIAIGGASAGAGMAAGLALLNRDQAGPPVAFQLLLYPMIDNLHDTASGRITNHPVWNQKTSFNAWEMYLDGVPGAEASPYAAASRATDLAGLPPAYICVGAEDLFRDENIEYARRLIAAGVPCELTVYPGLFHGGDAFMPTARLSQRLEAGFLQALGQVLDA